MMPTRAPFPFHPALSRSTSPAATGLPTCLHLTLADASRLDPEVLAVAVEAIASFAPRAGVMLLDDHVPARLLVPDAPTGDAWVWAQRLRRRVRRLTTSVSPAVAPPRVYVGIGDDPDDGSTATLIARAADAADHAQTNPATPIATWQLAALQQHVDALTLMEQLSPAERRSQLLRRAHGLMGPTQRQHVGAHCEQVAVVAARLAERLGLDDLTIERVRVAGLMHDIGKCAVPEDLLAKPGRLTGEQWAVMNLHTVIGADIAARLGCDADTTAFVRYHHTPYEEAAAQPPLGARLVCAADAFVTMTTHRSYRPAKTVDTALAELDRHRGRQFDPCVIDALQDMRTTEWRRAA